MEDMRKVRFWSGWTDDAWRKRYGDKVLLDFEEHCQPGIATTKFKRLPTKAIYHFSHWCFQSVYREHKFGRVFSGFFFYVIYVLMEMRVPNCGATFD